MSSTVREVMPREHTYKLNNCHFTALVDGSHICKNGAAQYTFKANRAATFVPADFHRCTSKVCCPPAFPTVRAAASHIKKYHKELHRAGYTEEHLKKHRVLVAIDADGHITASETPASSAQEVGTYHLVEEHPDLQSEARHGDNGQTGHDAQSQAAGVQADSRQTPGNSSDGAGERETDEDTDVDVSEQRRSKRARRDEADVSESSEEEDEEETAERECDFEDCTEPSILGGRRCKKHLYCIACCFPADCQKATEEHQHYCPDHQCDFAGCNQPKRLFPDASNWCNKHSCVCSKPAAIEGGSCGNQQHQCTIFVNETRCGLGIDTLPGTRCADHEVWYQKSLEMLGSEPLEELGVPDLMYQVTRVVNKVAIDELEGGVSNLENKLATANVEVDKAKEARDEALTQAIAQVKEEKERFKQLQELAQIYLAKEMAVETAVADLSTEDDLRAKSAVTRFQETFDMLRTALQEGKQAQAQAEADVKKLTGELQAARSDVERLTGELQAARSDVEKLTGDLQAAQAQSEADVERLAGELQAAQHQQTKTQEGTGEGGVVGRVGQFCEGIYTGIENVQRALDHVQTPEGKEPADKTSALEKQWPHKQHEVEEMSKEEAVMEYTSFFKLVTAALDRSHGAIGRLEAERRTQTDELQQAFASCSLHVEELKDSVVAGQQTFRSKYFQFEKDNTDSNRLAAMCGGLEKLKVAVSDKQTEAARSYMDEKIELAQKKADDEQAARQAAMAAQEERARKELLEERERIRQQAMDMLQGTAAPPEPPRAATVHGTVPAMTPTEPQPHPSEDVNMTVR